MVKTIVERLGIGYAARAVSYAGHGVDPHVVRAIEEREHKARDYKIAWTVDGQIEHKIEWIDQVTDDFVSSGPQSGLPNFIFLSHSIGSHLVQQSCVLRKDVLIRTKAIIHLMPCKYYESAHFYPQLCLNNLFLNPIAHTLRTFFS